MKNTSNLDDSDGETCYSKTNYYSSKNPGIRIDYILYKFKTGNFHINIFKKILL